MKYVAVEGCTVEITNLDVSASEIVITTPPSTNSSIDNKGIYCGTIIVILSNLSYNGHSLVKLTLTINGSSKTTQIDNKSVVLEGDCSINTIPSTFHAGESTTTTTVNVKISKANQKVLQSD